MPLAGDQEQQEAPIYVNARAFSVSDSVSGAFAHTRGLAAAVAAAPKPFAAVAEPAEPACAGPAVHRGDAQAAPRRR